MGFFGVFGVLHKEVKPYSIRNSEPTRHISALLSHISALLSHISALQICKNTNFKICHFDYTYFLDPIPTAHLINIFTNFGQKFFFFLPERSSGVHRGDPYGVPLCTYEHPFGVLIPDPLRGPVTLRFSFRSRTVNLRLTGYLTTP